MTENIKRRKFLISSLMGAVLAGAYGYFFSFVGRFLAPGKRKKEKRAMFAAFTHRVKTGESMVLTTPDGKSVLLANTGQMQAKTGHNFLAFSSRCPHLGCNVHYDAKEQKFICPCHQGAFDQNGVAIAGPPYDAGHNLAQFEIKKDGEALYLMTEV